MACSPPTWPSRSTTRAAPASTCTPLSTTSGTNIFGDPDAQDRISATGRHAIAGVLGHARALSALLNTTINSFKRFGPDTLAPWLIDRNEIDRFERFVTDWEFRKYAYHL